MFCNQCGKSLPDGTVVCPSCGKNLKDINVKNQKNASDKAHPWSSDELKKKSLVFLIAGLFLIVLSFVARTLGDMFPEQEMLAKMPTFCLIFGIVILVVSPILFILSQKK